MGDELRISVTVCGWEYQSREQVKTDQERAKRQFAGVGISVYAALRDDADQGILLFAGPDALVDRAEAEWQPEGGELIDVRDDIAGYAARRHLEEAGSIEVDEQGNYAQPRADLDALMREMDEIEREH